MESSGPLVRATLTRRDVPGVSIGGGAGREGVGGDGAGDDGGGDVSGDVVEVGGSVSSRVHFFWETGGGTVAFASMATYMIWFDAR